MNNDKAADKSHAGGDEEHDINFHWPNLKKLKNRVALSNRVHCITNLADK